MNRMIRLELEVESNSIMNTSTGQWVLQIIIIFHLNYRIDNIHHNLNKPALYNVPIFTHH